MSSTYCLAAVMYVWTRASDVSSSILHYAFASARLNGSTTGGVA